MNTVDNREIIDDGLSQQRKNLLWAIVTRAYRDAKKGDTGAIQFCYAIALKPSRLAQELSK